MELDSTLIIYESPFRIEKLLNETYEISSDRYVCLSNEITKIHEKFIRGNVGEVIHTIKGKKLKGEYVFLIGKEGFSI